MQTIDRCYPIASGSPLLHALVRCEVGLVEAFTVDQPVSWTTGSGIVRDIVDPGGPPQGTVYLQMVSGTAPTAGTFISANNIAVNTTSVPRNPQLLAESSMGALATFTESNQISYVSSVLSNYNVLLTEGVPFGAEPFTLVLGSAATPNLNIPVPEPGDHNPLGVLSAGIQRIDDLLNQSRRVGIHVYDADPVARKVLLIPRLPRILQPVRVTHKLNAGTCTVRFYIGPTGSTAITSALSVSSTTGSTTSVTVLNAELIWMEVASVSSNAEGLSVSLEMQSLFDF